MVRAAVPGHVPGPCPGRARGSVPGPCRASPARARPVPGAPCLVPGPCRAACPERIYRAGTPVPAVPDPRPGAAPSRRGPFSYS